MIFIIISLLLFAVLQATRIMGASKAFKAKKWRLKKTFCVCFQLERVRAKLRSRLMAISWMNDGWVREILKHPRLARSNSKRWKYTKHNKLLWKRVELNEKSKREGKKYSIKLPFLLISCDIEMGVCVINQSLFGGRERLIDHLELKAHLSRMVSRVHRQVRRKWVFKVP